MRATEYFGTRLGVPHTKHRTSLVAMGAFRANLIGGCSRIASGSNDLTPLVAPSEQGQRGMQLLAPMISSAFFRALNSRGFALKKLGPFPVLTARKKHRHLPSFTPGVTLILSLA
jgi:hypothetical protein